MAVGVMINTRNFASYGFISEAASAEGGQAGVGLIGVESRFR